VPRAFIVINDHKKGNQRFILNIMFIPLDQRQTSCHGFAEELSAPAKQT